MYDVGIYFEEGLLINEWLLQFAQILKLNCYE